VWLRNMIFYGIPDQVRPALAVGVVFWVFLSVYSMEIFLASILKMGWVWWISLTFILVILPLVV
jgi:hypothetical protein